jgi:hypothetical protein
MNETATNSLRLLPERADLEAFLASSQAGFWAQRNRPFKQLQPEQLREMVPVVGEYGVHTSHYYYY